MAAGAGTGIADRSAWAGAGAATGGEAAFLFPWKMRPHCLHRIGWLIQLAGIRSTFLHPGHFASTICGMTDPPRTTAKAGGTYLPPEIRRYVSVFGSAMKLKSPNHFCGWALQSCYGSG